VCLTVRPRSSRPSSPGKAQVIRERHRSCRPRPSPLLGHLESPPRKSPYACIVGLPVAGRPFTAAGAAPYRQRCSPGGPREPPYLVSANSRWSTAISSSAESLFKALVCRRRLVAFYGGAAFVDCAGTLATPFAGGNTTHEVSSASTGLEPFHSLGGRAHSQHPSMRAGFSSYRSRTAGDPLANLGWKSDARTLGHLCRCVIRDALPVAGSERSRPTIAEVDSIGV
jgi:hypothetical protein